MRISTLLSLCVLSLGARALAAQQPSAGPAAAGPNLMVHVATGGSRYCLDAKNDRQNEGTPVYVWKCHGKENQRWTVTKDQDGSSILVGTGGFCLDVRGQTSTANGTPVQLWRCHFLKNQRFTLTPDFKIREVESGKCLQALKPQDGSPVVLDDCHNTETEIWHFATI